MSDDDALDTAILEAVTQATSRLAKTILSGMVVIGLGGGIYVGSGKLQSSVRPDPYTGTDAALMRRELMLEIHRIDAIQQKMDFRMRQREAADEKCHETVQEHLRRHP